MDRDEARAALAHVEEANRGLARIGADTPAWRHSAFGAVFALLIGGATLPSLWQIISVALALGGVTLLVRYDRKKYGVFINGYRQGRTLPLTLALVGAMLGLVLLGFHARDVGWPALGKAGLAALGFVLAIGASVRWETLFQRDLQELQ